MKVLGIITVAIGTLSALTGCGSSSGGSGGGSSTTPNVINQVLSSLQAAAPDFTAARSLSSKNNLGMLSAIGTNLSTDNVFPNVDNPGSITETGIDYLGGLLGEESDNSVFQRAKMPFLISCTIDALATRGDNLYSTSQTSLTLSSSLIGACGEESDYIGGSQTSLIGTNVSISIADLADTTNYDQFIEMDGTANPQFGGNDQYMYIRNNTTTLNFMHIELNSGNTQVSVNNLHYNKSTESGYYQYVSFSAGGGFFVYRIYMDAGSDKARVFTYWNQPGGSAHTIITHIGSTFENQTSANLSISFEGLGAGGTTDLDNGNGCIDLTATPPNVSSDNTLTCGGTTINAVGAISGHQMTTDLAALNGGTIRTWASTPTSGDSVFPVFDDTTIHSAGFGF